MPVKISKSGTRYIVRTPGGVKAKGTTKGKAEAQARLLRGVEHGMKPKSHDKEMKKMKKKRKMMTDGGYMMA